jgi:hypothetical protein
MSSPDQDKDPIMARRPNPFDFTNMETRDLQEVRTQLNALQTHMGFQIFLSQMQQQIQTRLKMFILQDAGGIDGCINREYMRGNCASFEFIMGFVPMLVEGVEQELLDRGEQVGEPS